MDDRTPTPQHSPSSTHAEHKTLIAHLRDDDVVSGTFLVSHKSMQRTRTGEPYLRVVLRDRSGTIEARAWERVHQLHPSFEVEDFITVRGRAARFKGELQLTLYDLIRCDAPDDLRPFLPSSNWSGKDLLGQLRALLDTHVRSAPVRAVLDALLDDPDVAAKLPTAPAAVRNHHAYLGGLIEHILSMCRLALHVCDHYHHYYPALINRDLVLAGCVLHDLAKIDELRCERRFAYTDDGRLLGHIPLGVALLERVQARRPDLPASLIRHLQHLVVSHHGSREQGSPQSPQTIEAVILHHIDHLDARTNQLALAIQHAQAHAPDETWTTPLPEFPHGLFVGDRSAPWRVDLPDPNILNGPGLSTDTRPHAPAAASPPPEASDASVPPPVVDAAPMAPPRAASSPEPSPFAEPRPEVAVCELAPEQTAPEVVETTLAEAPPVEATPEPEPVEPSPVAAETRPNSTPSSSDAATGEDDISATDDTWAASDDLWGDAADNDPWSDDVLEPALPSPVRLEAVVVPEPEPEVVHEHVDDVPPDPLGVLVVDAGPIEEDTTQTVDEEVPPPSAAAEALPRTADEPPPSPPVSSTAPVLVLTPSPPEPRQPQKSNTRSDDDETDASSRQRQKSAAPSGKQTTLNLFDFPM